MNGTRFFSWQIYLMEAQCFKETEIPDLFYLQQQLTPHPPIWIEQNVTRETSLTSLFTSAFMFQSEFAG